MGKVFEIMFKTFQVCCFIFLLATTACKRAENSIVLIPENYQGNIVIVFDQQDGSEVEYSKNGERIYRIPSTGVLHTNFQSNKGGSISIFYSNEIGEKTLVPIIYRSDQLDGTDGIVCYDPRNGAVVNRYEDGVLVKRYPPYLSLLVAEMKRVEEFSKIRDDFALAATQGE